MTVKVFSWALAALAIGLWVVLSPPAHADAAPSLLGIGVIAALGALVEALRIVVVVRGSVMNSALTSVVLAIGMVTWGPAATLAGILLGALPTAVRHWRKRRHATVFNTALLATEAWLAAAIIGWPGQAVPQDSLRMALLVLGVVIITELQSGMCVVGVIRLHTGRLERRTFRDMAYSMVFMGSIGAPMAVLAVHLASDGGWALVPLGVLVALIVAIGRSQHGLVGHKASVLRLYEFIGRLEGQRDVGTLIRWTLEEAVAVLSASTTRLLLVHGQLATVHAFDGESLTTSPLDPRETAEVLALLDGGPRLVAAADAPPLVLSDGHVGPVVLAPFVGDELTGLLVVEIQPSAEAVVGEDEEQLAQALAHNAGRALQTADMLDELEQRAADLEHAARHDQTTDLLNAKGLAHEVPVLTGGALVVVELLDLPTITSALGPEVGVDAQRATGDRLQVLAGVFGHHVGHVAPGRFAIVMPDTTRDEARAAISRIRDVLGGTLTETQGFGLEARVAVGVTATDDAQPLDELLRQATSALVEHGLPTGEVGWFTPELDEAATDRLVLAADLRRAIDAGSLALAYQPKVDIRTGRIIGVEALSRWIHDERGFISPAVFIDIAERTGLIHDLTRAVMTTAVRQAAAWTAAGHQLTVAVNLAAASLEDPDLTDWILAVCAAEGLPADQLTCEVTESQVMGDLERCRATLRRMREAGLKVSIDDFGTGHSSLAQLKSMPVDELKIDRAFVMHLATDAADRAIAKTIIEMAQTFGLSTVAEGIEDAETLQVLHDLGCDVAQGYHLHRPMPAEAVDEVLATLVVR